MHDKKSLEEVLEEIRIIIPEIQDAGKAGKELLRSLRELKELEKNTSENIAKIADNAEFIASKLEAVEENEETMQILFERIYEIKSIFAKKSAGNILLVCLLTILAFGAGTYADFMNLKSTGFKGLFEPNVQTSNHASWVEYFQGLEQEAHTLRTEAEKLKRINMEAFPLDWKMDDGEIVVFYSKDWQFSLLSNRPGQLVITKNKITE